jgi:glycosyltransferase involved in cell wall biosynthesis
MRSKYVEAGWPGERMVVKYNTVAARPRPRHKRPTGFVCVSRLTQEKGIDVLLEAWRRAFPDGGEGLQIVGSGEHENALKGIAADIEGVCFRGQLPMGDVMQLLAECRASVIPSLWYEPFGRVTVEAFSAATSVIASRIGALPEIVRNGENGILVEPGSPSELAQALKNLAGSDRLTQELGERARSDYEANFAPPVTTAKLLSIYEYPSRGALVPVLAAERSAHGAR